MKSIRIVHLALSLSLVLWACARSAKTEAPPALLTETSMPVVINVEEPESEECAACHTDKQRLIDTARPEEAIEKGASGAG